DPDRGRRRRALLRDKTRHLARIATHGVRAVASDLFHRGAGAFTEIEARLIEGPVEDRVLAERVRSQIGRCVRHPHALRVTAHEGKVILEGPVLQDEVARVIAAAHSVRGVCGIGNRLAVHGRQDVPPLRGDPVRRWRPGTQRLSSRWAKSSRAIACASGATLALRGARRPGLLGILDVVSGVGLIARGVFDRDLRLVGGALEGDIDVRGSTTVLAPIARVFELWREPETYRRALTFVRSVERLDDRRLRWRLHGPSGTPLEWETKITQIVPDELISWRTVPGTIVDHAGSVRFESLSGEATRVTLRLRFRAPSVGPARALMGIFTVYPGDELRADLERFRSIAEAGPRVHTATADPGGGI
ncbi:MAG TPA: SRPBCC family protein, partial [Planctomycetota bacterium]|nr:SRPBCC family protein [Planctomycetota bacterium]